MAVGKRRTAREIAVQMLYQRDLGGSNLPQIFAGFDLSEYLVPERSDEQDEVAADHPALATRARIGGEFQFPEGARISTLPVPPARTPVTSAASGPAPGPASPKRRRQIEAAFEYAKSIVQGVAEHADELDELIRSQADNWRLERMPAVDRNILRLAVFEMLYEKDIPKLVVVDEAIELAKKFGSEQSSRFVNGLLDGLLKTHAFPGSLK